MGVTRLATIINSAESFGILPSDIEYQTFEADFPVSDQPVIDYQDADWQMGLSPNYPSDIGSATEVVRAALPTIRFDTIGQQSN